MSRHVGLAGALPAAVLVAVVAVAVVRAASGSGTVGPVRGGWQVVALGDSVVAGSGCACTPFVDRYAALVARETHRTTTARNLGVPGSTSRDLLRDLRPGGAAARGVAGADIVTVSIGANDMAAPRAEWARDGCRACFQRTAGRMERTLEQALAQVRRDAGPQRVEILVTTYWNVFEEATVGAPDEARSAAYQGMADTATLATDRAICAAAAAEHAACIDLYTPFKGDGTADARRLLADDGDHPNAAGHRLIARTLAAYGWRELGVPAVTGAR